MKGVNKVILLGNLGQAPELRHTKKGTAVANLSVATNYRRRVAEGEYEDDVEWHRVTVWGRTAEAVDEYLDKGSGVHVIGRLQTREYTDKDGVKRWSTEVVAEDVSFVGSSNGNGGSRRPEPPVGESDDWGGGDDFDDDLPF